jgi:hypothetical protein
MINSQVLLTSYRREDGLRELFSVGEMFIQTELLEFKNINVFHSTWLLILMFVV